MALIEMRGLKREVNLSLHVDSGNRPSGNLKIGDGESNEILIHLDYDELHRMFTLGRDDPRFALDTRKWTEKDRNRFADDLEKLAGKYKP